MLFGHEAAPSKEVCRSHRPDSDDVEAAAFMAVHHGSTLRDKEAKNVDKTILGRTQSIIWSSIGAPGK